MTTLVSAVFPNLLLTFNDDTHQNIESTELGIWAYPLLITNILVFGLMLLYFKKKIPLQLKNLIKYIFNFEISTKIAFLAIIILIGMYVIFSVGELFDGKFQADYYERVKNWIDNYSFTKIDTEGYNAAGLGGYLHVMLGVISLRIFGNVQVIPFLASISLLVLTYFITFEITRKRFSGIVSLVILLQSSVFLYYDTDITYPNFWITLYLFSLYLIYKKWPVSPFSFIASALTKIMTIAFLPMTLFFIYRSNIIKMNKLRLVSLYIIITVLVLVALNFTQTETTPNSFEFNSHDFLAGFNAIHTSLRFDPLIVLFILPLTVGLFFISKSGFQQADSILFLILGMLLSAVLIPAFGDTINAPYRFIPLVVFFAIGVGTLLSKRVTQLF